MAPAVNWRPRAQPINVSSFREQLSVLYKQLIDSRVTKIMPDWCISKFARRIWYLAVQSVHVHFYISHLQSGKLDIKLDEEVTREAHPFSLFYYFDECNVSSEVGSLSLATLFIY